MINDFRLLYLEPYIIYKECSRERGDRTKQKGGNKTIIFSKLFHFLNLFRQIFFFLRALYAHERDIINRSLYFSVPRRASAVVALFLLRLNIDCNLLWLGICNLKVYDLND